ncbi:hypothetical protein NYE70_00265 [Paenibacillus sp. FSL R5-0407]|uniref:hypothetical protein n=1 Tax=Paenibacillus sp. FSL R5-0407 TaxID=2975320 RepID=UPI0030FB5EF0
MAYQLKNEQLVIEIAEPGDYRGSRFDWNGFITDVTLLDGNHSYCVPESLVPGQGTGGAGLCNEFGIKEPIGYEDAPVGEPFPKLGVGLLTRPDDREYDFSRAYPVKPFATEIEIEGTRKITFRITPEDCRGYAVAVTKSVSIDNNRLTVEYLLHNTGTKPILTEEYCHNFFGIDGYPIGPDYVLKFPFELFPWADEEETLAGLIFSKGNAGEVRWDHTPKDPFYFRLPGFDGNKYPWIWELLHNPSGAGVREISRFHVSAAAVWGIGHVVSPEMFIEVKLAPGEQKTWSRVYEFFAKPD